MHAKTYNEIEVITKIFQLQIVGFETRKQLPVWFISRKDGVHSSSDKLIQLHSSKLI